MAENSIKNEFFERESIAIIAILAAMLLPALGRARDRARTIECASQLKQVGIAVQQYADSHNGRGVSEYFTTGGCRVYFPAQLYPYTSSKAIWKCPALTTFNSSPFLYGYYAAYGVPQDGWTINYGINFTHSSTSYQEGYHAMSKNYPLHRLPDPSNTIYFGDNQLTGEDDYTIGPGLFFSTLTSRYAPMAFVDHYEVAPADDPWPHANTANFVMTDGHIINVKQKMTRRYMWTTIKD